MIAVSQLLAVPCIIGVLIAPHPTMSYGLLFLAYMTAETWLGPAAAIVQVFISKFIFLFIPYLNSNACIIIVLSYWLYIPL